jgi:hypothetical protein
MLIYYVNDETYLISSSSLQPHFFAHSPSPPPTDRLLRAAFLDGAPSLWGHGREGVGGSARRRRRRPRRDGRIRWPIPAAAAFVDAVAAAAATTMAADRRDRTAG